MTDRKRLARSLAGSIIGAVAMCAALVGSSVAIAAVPGPVTEATSERPEAGGRLQAVLERLVQEGRLTAEQRDLVLSRVKEGTVKRDGGTARKPSWSVRGALMDAAATYLGMTRTEVRTALRDGKSLATLATERGKTRDGMVAALVAAGSEKIDAAVTAGTLTADRASAMRAKLPGLAAKVVDQVRKAKPPAGAP